MTDEQLIDLVKVRGKQILAAWRECDYYEMAEAFAELTPLQAASIAIEITAQAPPGVGTSLADCIISAMRREAQA